jgi:galactose mutarotase-like enzyme
VAPGQDSLCTRIEGQAWPYTFTRRLHLDGPCLCCDYTLENHAQRSFAHLWSAHPLLKVEPGMRVLLPGAVREVIVDNASSPALGQAGARRPWPELVPGQDFSFVQAADARVAVKVFVPRAPAGVYGVFDPATGGALTFAWDQRAAPHLGLWLCYGGWPGDGRPGQLTVALEPCDGMPDSLREAVRQRTCQVLGPGQRRTWSLRLRTHSHGHSLLQPGDAP